MNKLECEVFALRIGGTYSDSGIVKRLKAKGHTEEEIKKAISTVKACNQAALPIPQVTAHYENLPDGQVEWWQDNWFPDQWDQISKEEFEIRRRTLIMTYHRVVEGMPQD